MTDLSPWMLVPEVQQYARIGQRELLAALADGSLRGHQIKRGGTWRIHRDDVDAWLRGEAPAPINPRFTQPAPTSKTA